MKNELDMEGREERKGGTGREREELRKRNDVERKKERGMKNFTKRNGRGE